MGPTVAPVESNRIGEGIVREERASAAPVPEVAQFVNGCRIGEAWAMRF
jgi:hypothetical protein